MNRSEKGCPPAPPQPRVPPSPSLPQTKPATRLTLQFVPPSTSSRVFTKQPPPTECPLESPILQQQLLGQGSVYIMLYDWLAFMAVQPGVD